MIQLLPIGFLLLIAINFSFPGTKNKYQQLIFASHFNCFKL